MKNDIIATINFKISKNILLKIITFIFFVLFIPLSVNAEYNAIKLGKAAGNYIASTYYVHVFKNSQCNYICNYIPIKVLPIDAVITDFKQTFKKKDFVEMESLLKTNIKKETEQEFYNLYKDIHKTFKGDHKTSCGALVQNLMMQYSSAKKEWSNAKKKYAK